MAVPGTRAPLLRVVAGSWFLEQRIGASTSGGVRMGLMRTTRTATVTGTRAGVATGACLTTTARTAICSSVTGTGTRTRAAACTRVSAGRVVTGVSVATSACGGVVDVQV